MSERDFLVGNVLDEMDSTKHRLDILERVISTPGTPETSGDAFNVRHYGAVGDGVTDDTVAFQAALDVAHAAGAATLFAPPGEYIISVSTMTETIGLRIYPDMSIRGAGAGLTTIKLADSQGNFFSLMAPQPVSADMSNFSLIDLTIDMNGAGNPVASAGDLTGGNPRFALQIYTGQNIRVHRCRFVNARGVNTIVTNGVNMANVHITECTFDGIGGGSVDFDHSTIYTNCTDAVITDNIFKASSVLANGARTAIETHGSRHTVAGNQVYGYAIGSNITGVYHADSVGNVISDNSVMDCLFGFIIWSQQSGAHTTGFGMDGLTVAGNHIKIVAPASRPSATAVGGIYFEPNGNLPSRNITIASNVIWSELESVEKVANNASVGIGWFSTANMALSNVTITGNVITNFPAAAIRLSVGTLDNCVISGNTIKNPGSTLNAITTTFKSGIMVITATDGVMRRVKVTNNIITDDIDTSRMAYGIFVLSTTLSHDVELLWNSVDVTGSTTTAFVAPYFRSGSNTNVLLVGAHEGFSVPSSNFARNSRIWDRANGVVWECVVDLSWVTRSYGTAAPATGTWRRGDVVWNSLPSASGNIGWTCVTAGTPGTWKAFGAIDA
jgi:hypothetical protein